MPLVMKALVCIVSILTSLAINKVLCGSLVAFGSVGALYCSTSCCFHCNHLLLLSLRFLSLLIAGVSKVDSFFSD